jgi:hypothetical protein
VAPDAAMVVYIDFVLSMKERKNSELMKETLMAPMLTEMLYWVLSCALKF